MADQNIIKASPTKEFFIDMLTRDIPLNRAIIDLIDNSIDGAKQVRKKEDYHGLKVEVSVSKDQFIIKDNCGGFPLSVAKEYAFRFGRPKEAKFVEHSIGRFGVGMKRALFKIGKSFTVESKNKTDHFLVSVDVASWLSKPEEWDFSYVEKDKIPAKLKSLDKEDGTVIIVNNLYDNIASDFGDNVFLNDLEKEISLALNYSILKGLEIDLNKKVIIRKDISFLWGDHLKPYFKKIPIVKENVVVSIYCGIGEPLPSVAGWYIFCNDRLVLEADKSYTTGWKEAKEDEGNIIKYHNKFAMFRGVVMFDSPDSSKLPMTTTKTGIDAGHPVYKAARPEMLFAMKQVLGFLNTIDDRQVRDDIVANAKPRRIDEVRQSEKSLSPKFVAPKPAAAERNREWASISYSRKSSVIEKLKEIFNVSTNREVGEKTFDYYVNVNKTEL
ncbi:ATP-binding protein [Mucilaginibacter sp.]